MQKINLQNNKGFTIIETMIAISLFLIVVTIGMGSLLNANLLHQKSQDMRSIMDNLSFIMEDMSRNLRTGSDYNLINYGGGISFKSALGDDWKYTLEYDEQDEQVINIKKYINGNSVQLNPEEVKIDPASSFTVTGNVLGDSEQPFVIIKLIGIISSRGVDTPFSLQTSVSQRLIDIEAPQGPEIILPPAS